MEDVLSRIKTELELKDCTFHPQLSTSRSASRVRDNMHGSGGTDSIPVYERLNKQAELQYERQLAEASRREEEEKAERKLASHPHLPKRVSALLYSTREKQ
jgi:hypothetical protein